MLDIINNALRNNNYYVCLYKNYVYIYNYIEIISFSNDVILIKLDNINLKVKGHNMKIIKMEIKELLISGDILGANYE